MAATVVSVKLEGGANLRRALSKLNPAENGRIFSVVMKQAAVLIRKNAQQVQIRSGGGKPIQGKLTHRSRELRRSIKTDFRGAPRFVEVGTELFYGAIHEYGGTFKRKKGGTITFPKRPFMEPALDAIRPRIPALIVRVWKKEGGLNA